MDTELIRAKVVVALDELRTKKVGLEKGLSEKRELLHARAWEEYGSELSVSDMFFEEQLLVGQTDSIQKQIDVLEAFQRGEIELEARDAFVEQMKVADEKIAELTRTREECLTHIARIDAVLRCGIHPTMPVWTPT